MLPSALGVTRLSSFHIDMPTDLIIGGIGLVALSHVFEQALRAYDFFIVASRTANDDCHTIATKVLIEKHRFELYGKYMNLSRNGRDRTIQSHSNGDQNLISSTIQRVESLLVNTDKLFEYYGIMVRHESGDVEMGELRSSLPPTEQSDTRRASHTLSQLKAAQVVPSEMKASQKLRWTWKDNAQADKLHRDLRDLNDQLWNILAPHTASMLAKGVPSFVLPGLNDWSILHEISETSQDNNQGILQDCADLRSTITTSESELTGSGSDRWRHLVLRKQALQISASSIESGTNLSFGKYHGVSGVEQVLIEYKTVHPDVGHKDRALVKHRLHHLTFSLSKGRSPEICLFQSVGFFEATTNPLRYGLVYKLPETDTCHPPMVSLASLLAEGQPRFQYLLGDRFRLAAALANAVLHTHASGWFHKNIRPENIFFQKIEAGQAKVSQPWLLGFGSARPSDVNEKSLLSEEDRGSVDWYRHPDYQSQKPNRRFEHRFDYFSLGVVLACVGPWEGIDRLVSKFGEKHPRDTKNASTWARFLHSRMETYNGFSCGQIYRDVVLRCLTADIHAMTEGGPQMSEADWQKWFLFQVVHQLQRCSA